jgi:hypothetical protein
LFRRKVVSGFVLLWFHYSKEEEDDNFRHLLRWLSYNNWQPVLFFASFATKKVTAAMSLPSSIVVVI